MGINMRVRQASSVPAMAIAIFVAMALAVTVLVVLRRTGASFGATTERPQAATTEPAPATAPEWDVLRSPRAVEIPPHRPGVTPIDIARTHAFGREGLTIREAMHSAKLIEVLRRRPGLTPLDPVRIGWPVHGPGAAAASTGTTGT